MYRIITRSYSPVVADAHHVFARPRWRPCREMTTTTTSSSSRSDNTKKPRAVFLNAARLDYDGRLDWSRIRELVDIELCPYDRVDDVQLVLDLVQNAEIVLTKEMPVPAATLAQFPDSVRVLMEAGTGYNNLPVRSARARHIPVMNVPSYSSHAVAHMAITYLMNFSVSMLQQQRMLQDQDRRNFTGPFTLPLHELNDHVIGLVGGAGRIGTHVAQVALALGMHVIISSRKGQLSPDHDLYGHERVTCTSDVSYLLQNSDYVSLHTPLNDETRGSFRKSHIEQMKPTAYLINTSRGAVIEEEELIECLLAGTIAGAGLDVTVTEPPAPDSRIWNIPNCWLSPHTGWRRHETRQRLVHMLADNLHAYVNATGEHDLINVVN